MRPSFSHEFVVQRLVADGAESRGFLMRLTAAIALRRHEPLHEPASPSTHELWRNLTPKACRKLLDRGRSCPVCAAEIDDDEDGDCPDPIACAMRWTSEGILGHAMPDAFSIDIDTRRVIVHEVVRTSDFDPRKYAALWFDIDCESWSLEVKVWSGHGGLIGGYSDDDLANIWIGELAKDPGPTAGLFAEGPEA